MSPMLSAGTGTVLKLSCSTVNCMLLCPEHRKTSPKSTFLSAASWFFDRTEITCGPPAGCAGSVASQTPSASTVSPLATTTSSSRTSRLIPGSAVPHTLACCGAR
eukprot:Amastigsp_a8068_7.p4 type:complete len:105 gc:universal Amastigsp_a8068_7:766-1080(+)